MGVHDRLFCSASDAADDARWASSGAMALTGWAGGSPLRAPEGLVPFARSAADVIEQLTGRHGTPVRLDALALLGERAAIAGLGRRGRRSCGGASRLLPCVDGWVAVSLARPDDRDLVPLWLGTRDVATGVGTRVASDLVAAAAELGLPCAQLAERAAGSPAPATRVAVSGSRPSLAEAVVVDLSALWAGPLCGHVLTLAGARTIKVESVARPDGARRGPPAFFDLLHAGQESVALDLRCDDGVDRLRRLLRTADVVIESSRPRAMSQLGIDPEVLLADRPMIWVSITGHGRTGVGAHRVAFGDDAAVAGGLVARDDDGPVFCADAVADPLAGLAAAALALDRWSADGSWIVDVAMAEVAARCARRPAPADTWTGPVAAPRARRATGRAPELGRDNERVLAELVA